MIGDIEAAKRVAGSALAHYGSVPGQVDPALTFVKYRENYVFRADHEGVTSALRVHRKGYRTDVEIAEELDLITALADAGVSVPRVRRTVDGRPFCHVIDDDGDVHQVDLLEWVPDATTLGDIGAAVSGEAEIDREAFHALGALIAGLHNIVAILPRTNSVRPAWDAEGLVGARPVWGDPRRAFVDGARGCEVVERAMALLGAELAAYGATPDRYGAIHADFTPENVLVHGGDPKNARMTIIDFDDSGDGYYLFDLATAAFFYLPHPQVDDVVSALLAGYRSVRPLTEADFGLWRPMLLARGLTYLGWAADRPGDETSDFVLEHVRPVVVDLAAEYVASAVAR